VGPRNHVLDWVKVRLRERAILRVSDPFKSIKSQCYGMILHRKKSIMEQLDCGSYMQSVSHYIVHLHNKSTPVMLPFLKIL